MKVRLEKSFAVPAPTEAAWAFLQDIEAVAACMPGALITERIDETHYKGAVTVKLGPATLTFRGDIEVCDIDPGTRSLRLLAKGTDTTGTSGAAIDLAARIEAEGATSRLAGTSEISMSGKAAAFGGRMVSTLSDRVLDQFARNFALRAAAPAAAEGAPAPAAAGPNELNGVALAWSAFKAWLRSLFTKTPA
jgi:uncharacterized protein